MCKIKEYTERMKGSCEQISFRLDFYSFPEFARIYTQQVYEMFKRVSYAHRELTDEEKLTVDVDSASETFGINVGDLIERRNDIFKGLVVEGYKVDLYISPLYVFVSMGRIEGSTAGILKLLYAALNLDGILDKQELQNITVMTRHKVAGESEENVFEWLDRSAFPIMDDTALANGRYLDTHDYDDCSVDLLRLIRKGNIDGTPRVEVSIQTRSIPAENLEINDEIGIGGQIEIMLEKSLSEVTRCFK